MEIEAEFHVIYVPEEKKQQTHTWGVANVVVNGVEIHNIRAINRITEKGEWQHFFAYPKIKIGDRYQDVLQITRQQKEEIEAALQIAAKEHALKGLPEISVDKIHVVKSRPPLLAIADVTVNGIGIKSVRLYQNEDGGRFAQLPQYQDSEGQWKNLVQFDNAYVANSKLTRCMDMAYKDAVAEADRMREQENRCR